jgi:excisionase family DNA binding protein
VAGLSVELSQAALEAIAERVAAMLQPGCGRQEDPLWPEWIGVETAARYLDVSPERVRKLQARGRLPYYQDAPGCRVFFNRRELDDAMRQVRTP